MKSGLVFLLAVLLEDRLRSGNDRSNWAAGTRQWRSNGSKLVAPRGPPVGKRDELAQWPEYWTFAKTENVRNFHCQSDLPSGRDPEVGARRPGQLPADNGGSVVLPQGGGGRLVL